MENLNTQNPDHITWKYEQLLFAVLGGIRLEGLDRMRVTLKTEFKGQAIRHNLDLYNDTQVEKLVRKTAERFSIGTSYIGKAIAELTNELENYRMEEIKKQSVKQETKKILTEEEKQAAIQFLQQENLLKRTNELIGKSGVIGEELNRLLMFLIFTSRKTYRPLHIVSFGSSGVGKSHLQEKVSELIPQEDKIEITSITGNAFYYLDKDELGHKVILIEDLDGVLAALYPIRELQTKQKIRKTITIKDKRGNAKTIHLVVYGPVSIAGCTTQERIYEDNANRSFLIYLDESEEQDEKVMHYQRLLSAGKINIHEEMQIKIMMQNVQRVLQPITVRNPYAEYLKIPKEVFKPRRTNAHYIAFIEAVTFYKQYQREQKTDEETGELYIETTLEDIAEANAMMKHILLRKSDELSGAARAYFEKVKQYTQSGKLKHFTNKEIRAALRINPNTQKMYMQELQYYGYIHKTEGDKKKGFIYTVVSYEEYEQLQTRINTVLDEISEALKKEEGEKLEVVVSKSQPLKTNNSEGNGKRLEKMPEIKKRPPKEKNGIRKPNQKTDETFTPAEQQL